MTATQAKEILKDIPTEDFITLHYTDSEKCCSIGHLRRVYICSGNAKNVYDASIIDFDKSTEIIDLENKIVKEFGMPITIVNDYVSNPYIDNITLKRINDYIPNANDLTPKERVIALLDLAIERGL